MRTLPSGWTMRGELPDVDFDDAGEERRDLFDEDILTITAPGGVYALDVGWYPSQSATGSFQGRLIEGGGWDEPLEVFSTTSVSRIAEWIDSAIESARELMGERVDAEFSNEIAIPFVVHVRAESALTQDRPETGRFATAPAEQSVLANAA